MKKSCIPLVSVVIPTFNSGKTLKACIESVWQQSFKDIEIIVVDSYSRDNTIAIAMAYNCRIIQTHWKLLGARYLGAENCNGKYVLALDSDQVLKRKDLIKEVLSLFSSYDMLILAESSYMPTTWLEHLADADRKLMNSLIDVQLDPSNGNLLPRFFKKELYLNAFKKMDKNVIRDVVIFEDAVTYYELYKLSTHVGFVPEALSHMDVKGFGEFFRHNYRYGVSARLFKTQCTYAKFVTKRQGFRKGSLSSGKPKLVFQSYLLLILKGIAYEAGYLLN